MCIVWGHVCIVFTCPRPGFHELRHEPCMAWLKSTTCEWDELQLRTFTDLAPCQGSLNQMQRCSLSVHCDPHRCILHDSGSSCTLAHIRRLNTACSLLTIPQLCFHRVTDPPIPPFVHRQSIRGRAHCAMATLPESPEDEELAEFLQRNVTALRWWIWRRVRW